VARRSARQSRASERQSDRRGGALLQQSARGDVFRARPRSLIPIASLAQRLSAHGPMLVEQAWWAAGALWLAVVLSAFLAGPGLCASREEFASQQAEVENQVVCGRLGMPPGEARYSACAAELDEVRRLQKERTTAEWQELF
jgi:hypothetical protein